MKSVDVLVETKIEKQTISGVSQSRLRDKNLHPKRSWVTENEDGNSLDSHSVPRTSLPTLFQPPAGNASHGDQSCRCPKRIQNSKPFAQALRRVIPALKSWLLTEVSFKHFELKLKKNGQLTKGRGDTVLTPLSFAGMESETQREWPVSVPELDFTVDDGVPSAGLSL